mgnify:FL=1
MTPEGRLVVYLRRRVKSLGGETRKCAWTSHIGAPDQLVLFPCGIHFWVELKAPGKRPRRSQMREFDVMKRAGCAVFVADCPEDIEAILRSFVFDGGDRE